MPILFFLVIVLCIYSSLTGEFLKTFSFLFNVNPNEQMINGAIQDFIDNPPTLEEEIVDDSTE